MGSTNNSQNKSSVKSFSEAEGERQKQGKMMDGTNTMNPLHPQELENCLISELLQCTLVNDFLSDPDDFEMGESKPNVNY